MSAQPDLCSVTIDLRREEAKQDALDALQAMKDERIKDRVSWLENWLEANTEELADHLDNGEKDKLLRQILESYKDRDDTADFGYMAANVVDTKLQEVIQRLAEEQIEEEMA